MTIKVSRILSQNVVALSLMTHGLGIPTAIGQVTYNDSAAHLLDEVNGPPNGDLMQGVLVEADSTLTIRDINANGLPAIGGVGFTLMRNTGDVQDVILAATDTSEVNIEGGDFQGSLFQPDQSSGDLKLNAFDNARLHIRGGRFSTPKDNALEAADTSTIHLTGGIFVSTDQANNLLATDAGQLIVDGGEFVTQGPADDSNSFNTLGAFGQSTITVASGVFRSSGQNLAFSSGGTLNIAGGSFIADNGVNFLISTAGTTHITGGAFSAAGGLPAFGSIANFVRADTDAVLNIRGGVFMGETVLNARFTSVMNIHGGSFPTDTTLQLGEAFESGSFFDNENPTAHLHGTGFSLDGNTLDFGDSDTLLLFDFDGTDDAVGLLDGTDVLTGVFADGSPFSLTIDVASLNDGDLGGQIVLHIPEPAAIAILSLVTSVMVLRRPQNQRGDASLLLTR